MPTPPIIIEPRPMAGDSVIEPGPALGPELAAAPRKPRRFARFAGWLLAIGVLWCAWAGYALYDLATAVENWDAVALERRIDWVAVRQSLRDDLGTAFTAGKVDAPDGAADALAKQASIAALIRSARFTERGWDTAAPDSKVKDRGFEWHRIHYAFFSGDPFAFRVDIRPGSETPKRPLVLLFKWKGDWQLSRVFLPADVFGAPTLASAADAKPQQTPPAGASRAMLYEEDTSDPKGKSYIGWVKWRVETPSAASGMSGPDVTADVNIPGRSLSVAMTIRRNPDRTLPASHTIDVKFELPADSPTRGVLDVGAIQMKPSEDAAGQQLAGSHVKVSNNVFLVGLSAIELDVQNNLQMMKDRPWVGITYVYNNNRRAVLSIEKGEAGNKVMTEALERWATASTVENSNAKK